MSKKMITISALVSIAALAALLLVAYFIKPSYNSEEATVAQESGEKYVVNGYSEKVTDPDSGDPYVYVTDADGETKKNEDGEIVTAVYNAEVEQQFEEFSEAASKRANNETTTTEVPTAPTLTIEDGGSELSPEEITSETETDAQESAQSSSADVIGKVDIN